MRCEGSNSDKLEVGSILPEDGGKPLSVLLSICVLEKEMNTDI